LAKVAEEWKKQDMKNDETDEFIGKNLMVIEGNPKKDNDDYADLKKSHYDDDSQVDKAKAADMSESDWNAAQKATIIGNSYKEIGRMQNPGKKMAMRHSGSDDSMKSVQKMPESVKDILEKDGKCMIDSILFRESDFKGTDDVTELIDLIKDANRDLYSIPMMVDSYYSKTVGCTPKVTRTTPVSCTDTNCFPGKPIAGYSAECQDLLTRANSKCKSIKEDKGAPLIEALEKLFLNLTYKTGDTCSAISSNWLCGKDQNIMETFMTIYNHDYLPDLVACQEDTDNW
jgi:hypothetical protein